MRIETPFGPVYATVDASGALTALGFREQPSNGRDSYELRGQMAEYFAGERQTFSVKMDPPGTAFQKAVWTELMRVPFGATISYGELAKRVNRPGAARAVGKANATNPIALIVPCHRVIGSNGTLTGYAWGLELKEKLLKWELLKLSQLIQKQEQRHADNGVDRAQNQLAPQIE